MSAVTSGLKTRGNLIRSIRRRHPVAAFMVRRIFASVIILLVVSAVVFFATNLLPGNMAELALGRDATPESLAILQTKLGLDQPVLIRYLQWLGGILTGDLGNSAAIVVHDGATPEISKIIATPLFNSFFLAVISMIIFLPLSLSLGMLAAVRSGRKIDRAISVITLAIGSLPEFVFGAFMIAVFFVWLHLLPPTSGVFGDAAPWSNPAGLVLPIAVLLGAVGSAAIRMIRANMIDVLQQDYVSMARLNGYSERTVLWSYALRNAMTTSVQVLAANFRYMIGGLIVVEAVFAYPGIGTILVAAVKTRDVPVVASVSLILAASYITINMLADLIVVLATPRLRNTL